MKFNDDYYNRSIEEWENEMVRQRVTSQKITWECICSLGCSLLVFLLPGGSKFSRNLRDNAPLRLALFQHEH